VKAIAEAHGGTVQLESEEGKGSRFVLRIPSGGMDAGGATDDSAAADTAGRSGSETAGKGPPADGPRHKGTGAAGGKPNPAGPASGIELATRAGGTP
jgi:hypothetical protein